MPGAIAIVNNKKLFRFETDIPGQAEAAFIQYRWLKANMVLMHTFVPQALRNKGLAAQLTQFILTYAQQHGLKIIPYCPYIQNYLSQHPEYQFLVAS